MGLYTFQNSLIPIQLLKFSKLHLQLLLVKFTSSFRLFGIIIQAISGTVGNLILYLVVYFVRHWVHLHLAAGILSLLSLPSFLIIPESPRCTMIQFWDIVSKNCMWLEQNSQIRPFFNLPTYPQSILPYCNDCFSIATSNFWKTTYLLTCSRIGYPLWMPLH